MENPKNQLLERLKPANNVLITVSSNPSVDQLSAAIGLTLMLNKMGKHATAVFSGQVPSTIEFLQPEKTLEKNTDSLRDFIIALDKTKADKLRYKVEDSHVKIFITPYKTSITDADLEFSQGDFNVEVVVALGVKDQAELDKVITAHGRILHDATTISVTNDGPSTLGSINWADPHASSLCEMIASLADLLQKDILDNQTATALMTGIVAETERFRNEKTTPAAMSASAALMAAGANQQLVTSELEQVAEPNVLDSSIGATQSEAELAAEGSLAINHEEPEADLELPQFTTGDEDDNSSLPSDGFVDAPEDPVIKPSQSAIQGGSSLILDRPLLGGQLTANSEPEHLDPSTDPLGVTENNQPILSHSVSTMTETKSDDVADSGDEVTSPGLYEPLPSEPEAAAPVTDPLPLAEVPLPAPSMDLPSESANITPLNTPSEQSIEPPVDPYAPPVDTSTPPSLPTEQTLSDLEASVKAAEEAPIAADTLLTDEVLFPSDPQAFEPDVSSAINSLEPSEPSEDLTTTVDSARDAVSDALASLQNQPLPPIVALNAHPLDLEIKQTGQTGMLDSPPLTTSDPSFTMPTNLVPETSLPADSTATMVSDPSAPPVVPPPFMPDMNAFMPPADE